MPADRPYARAGRVLAPWRRAAGYLLPLALLIGGLVLVPVIGTVIQSAFRDVVFLPRSFVGLENYARLLDDPAFWQAARFTVLFMLASVPLELVLGLGIALVLNQTFVGRGLLRALVLIPWVIPAAVSGRIFERIVASGEHGAASWLLQRLDLADQPVHWLGSEAGSFLALLVADAWKTTPFVAIILLAGLAQIPVTLYDQARVDGASLWRRFTAVTLPLLRPVLVVAVLFRMIEALRIFDVVYVLTGGGPGGTTTSLSLLAYAHYSAGDLGYGAATSTVLFLVTFALALVVVRVGRFGRELS